jgi:hypothetical protein
MTFQMAATYCSFVSELEVKKERDCSYVSLDVLILEVEGMLPDIHTNEGGGI